MCYDGNARPPGPEGAAGAGRGEDLVLEAADGNRFAAYLATPSAPASAQVLILPDPRGLHQFYKDLALRFAEIGVAAIAMDYFGRTAVMTRDFGNGTLLDHAGAIRTPALGLFGGADQGIPVETVEEFDRRLDATGVAHEIVIYPGAPHSFFDRRFAEFADASADAWERVRGFIAAQ